MRLPIIFRRTRSASAMPPPLPPLGYIRSLRGDMSAVKGSGPLFDAFMGINSDSEFIYGDDKEGYTRAYLASVWAARCIRLRSRVIAGVPRIVCDSDGNKVEDHRNPLVSLFGRRSNRLFSRLETQLLIYGEAFWRPYMERGQLRVQVLNPLTMEVKRNRHGIEAFIQRIDNQVTGAWEPDDIIYFTYGIDPDDDLGGKSPTAWLLETIGIDASLQRFDKTFFENDATPGLLLTTEQDLFPQDQERYVAMWEQRYRGANRAHKPAMLGKGLSVQQITPDMDKLAKPELDEKTKRRIAAAYDVPMTIALMDDAANYATAQEQRKGFYNETILPQWDALCGAINEQFVDVYTDNGLYLDIDKDEIEALQEDRVEITQRSTQAFTGGIRSLNEARDLEDLPPLPVDMFMIPGVGLVKRDDLEAGKLPAAPTALPGLFGGVASLPPVTRKDKVKSAMIEACITDLRRWEKKASARGVHQPFSPDHLPRAMADFIRMDLAAGEAIKDVFDTARAAIKLIDADLATPEEFDEYWQGIGDLYDELAQAVMDAWRDVMPAIARLIRTQGTNANVAALLNEMAAQQRIALEPTLQKIYLAGTARGNDLLNHATKDLTIAWDIINEQAAAWAQQYSSQLVTQVTNTTRDTLADQVSAWVSGGGSLDDLAAAIEGTLVANPPAGVSPERLAWLTSPQRAALIAQTETTRAFAEGVIGRWQQAGVQQMRWRTNQDAVVCPTCMSLNNRVGNINEGVPAPNGALYKPPAHPGCRCLLAPVVT